MPENLLLADVTVTGTLAGFEQRFATQELRWYVRRYAAGRLQQAYQVVRYEGGMAVSSRVEWENVPVVRECEESEAT